MICKQECCHATAPMTAQFWSLLLDLLMQTTQDFNVEFFVHSSTFRDKFQMHWILMNTSSVTFSLGWSWWNFCFHGDCGDFLIAGALLDCRSYKKCHFSSPVIILLGRKRSLSTAKIKYPAISIWIVFRSLFKMQKIMYWHTLCMSRSLISICWHLISDILTDSAIWQIVCFLFVRTTTEIFLMFSSVREVTGQIQC